MPELPEVHTTTEGLRKKVLKKQITDVWTDYFSTYPPHKGTIKEPAHFKKIRRALVGNKITEVSRVGKHIIFHIDKNIHLLAHMKMTGHFLYGKYAYDRKENKWTPLEPVGLKDPYSRFIHFVISFKDGHHLAFSDARKFARLELIVGKHTEHKDLSKLGPDAHKSIKNWQELKQIFADKKPTEMKRALLNQELLAGIGNIYSDEILWMSDISPFRKTDSVVNQEWKKVFNNMKKILEKSISFGGDSLSDYRNINGERGHFQDFHKVYGKKGEKCSKKGCGGIIKRTVIGGRSCHYCDKHQI